MALAPATKIWDMTKLVAVQLKSSANIHAYSIVNLIPMVDLAIQRLPAYNSFMLGKLAWVLPASRSSVPAGCSDLRSIWT